MVDKPGIIGRFAPSPTGALHLGSLYTALASFLQARSQQGRWLLRIDDLDTPRNRPGSVESILHTLSALGLAWDGEVVLQSQHRPHYQRLLTQLTERGWLYRCDCNRKILTASEQYSGRCRHRVIADTTPHALRLKAGLATVSFVDRLQGAVAQTLAAPDDDFIVQRKDQIIAYQFAVVVDDYLQQVNEVVRGCDLLAATPKQVYLRRLLGFPEVNYLHVPVIVDGSGQKLSKQTLATAVDTKAPAILLWQLLALLQQQPPTSLRTAPTSEILAWAINHWQPGRLAGQQSLVVD